eukprot:2104123-Rhodomonas_salina.1
MVLGPWDMREKIAGHRLAKRGVWTPLLRPWIGIGRTRCAILLRYRAMQPLRDPHVPTSGTNAAPHVPPGGARVGAARAGEAVGAQW